VSGHLKSSGWVRQPSGAATSMSADRLKRSPFRDYRIPGAVPDGHYWWCQPAQRAPVLALTRRAVGSVQPCDRATAGRLGRGSNGDYRFPSLEPGDLVGCLLAGGAVGADAHREGLAASPASPTAKGPGASPIDAPTRSLTLSRAVARDGQTLRARSGAGAGVRAHLHGLAHTLESACR
jgi:hypothetical protein